MCGSVLRTGKLNDGNLSPLKEPVIGPIWFYLGLVLACGVGWVAGEILKLQPLRIVCIILLLPLVGVAFYALGQYGGSATASMELTGATTRFFDAAVERLDAGDEGEVRRMIKSLQTGVNETYERGGFIDAMNEATAQLTPSAESER